MDVKGKRTSLRESFVNVLSKKSVVTRKVNRLKGVQLFRSAVRRVLLHMKWLTEVPPVEEVGDDVAIKIKMAQAKKVEKKALNIQDRSILLINPEERSAEDKLYIYDLFKKFRVFKKYPENLREALAEVCYYQHVQPGQVIVRQGRPAENLYFIVSGEVNLSRMTPDRWTGESKKIEMGTLSSGDIFGEVALLHKLPRSATVLALTSMDLIMIYYQDFDEILQPTLLKEWSVLQDALINFNYFKGWDETMMRECCILSKIKDFQYEEVLLGDGKGLVNYVHFLLEGECQLIEHIIVREERSVHGVHYKLYDPKTARLSEDLKRSSRSLEMVEQKMDDLLTDHEATKATGMSVRDSEEIDYTQMLLSSKPIEKRVDFDRSSIFTTTLLDVITKWHKITDVAEMLLREPSSISQQCYPNNVRTIFMQICTFRRGACFGLGENMIDRRIVAKTNVRCLLVPRYWINEHNRANIWERVKLFMDSKFPTKKQLFRRFVKNRKWRKYRKDLVNDIRREGRCIHSNVSIHDVPYSIRIVNDMSGES